MKRMVFVQQDPTIPSKAGTIIPVRASSLDFPDLKIKSGGQLQYFNVPLRLRTAAPGPRGDEFSGRADEFHLQIRTVRKLFDAGVMMVGAYFDGNNVRMAFMNFGDTVNLMEKEVVAEAVLCDTVSYFQQEPAFFIDTEGNQAQATNRMIANGKTIVIDSLGGSLKTPKPRKKPVKG